MSHLYLKDFLFLKNNKNKKKGTNSPTQLLKIQTELKPLTGDQPQFKHSLLLLCEEN